VGTELLCYVMLCYVVMLSYVMLCYIMKMLTFAKMRKRERERKKERGVFYIMVSSVAKFIQRR